MASLKSVRRLGEELLTSKAHLNNAPALLSLLSKGVASPQNEDCLLHALLSLQAFFTNLLSRTELSAQAYANAQLYLQSRTSEQTQQAEAIYQVWLWDKYNEFLDVLLKYLVSPVASLSVQVASMDALMEFVRKEKPGDFNIKLFSKLCSTLVQSENFNTQMIEHLVSNYFNFVDVCRHTCINLRKMIIARHQGKGGALTKGSAHPKSFESLLCNTFDILCRMSISKANGKDFLEENWCVVKNDNKMVNGKNEQAEIKKASEKKASLSQDVKKLRSKITRAWLAFLRLPLTPAVYEKVLGHMHKAIIPNLTNPILLSDFLTNSYNQGGLISVMALNGLFLLITQYGLEYPEFYNKLYALLEPSMFVAKYRARFFELLDLSLKSPLLPAYLAAAFAKKLGRLALMSPPAGAIIVIAVVHNLLRRHPSINCLVHQDLKDAEPPLVCSQEVGSNGEYGRFNGEEDEGVAQSGRRPEADPFDMTEVDPARSNALQSSLWEMDTLRHHYCPAVSRFVASLEADLTVRAKTTELSIKDFSSGSYATIFAEEVKRRMKRVPLAFYQSVPTTLFPKASAGGQTQALGLMEFAGWSFSCKPEPEDAKNTGNNMQDNDGGLVTDNREDGSYFPNRVNSEIVQDELGNGTDLPSKKKKRVEVADS